MNTPESLGEPLLAPAAEFYEDIDFQEQRLVAAVQHVHASEA